MKSSALLRSALALLAFLPACGGDGPTPPEQRVPAALEVVSGGGQTGAAGAELADPVRVRVTDARGRPVPGASVTFAVTQGGGSVEPSTAATDADGRAETRWTLGPQAGQAQALGAAVFAAGGAGAPLAQASATATANAGPPAAVALVAGDPQAAPPGAALADSLAVRVTDALGNPVQGATVTWAVTAGGGSVSPATAPTRADGVAKTAWRMGAAPGEGRATATVAGLAPVEFRATANVLLTLTVLDPPPHHNTTDVVRVRATAATTRFGDAVAYIRAAVEDRQVTLSPDSAVPTGRISLAGLPGGARTLRVWAVTLAGDSVERQVSPINLMVPPRVTFASPQSGDVSLDGRLRLDIDCDDPACQIRVRLQDGVAYNDTIATGTGSIHRFVNLPATAEPSSLIFLTMSATTPAGGVSVERRIFYFPSTRLTQVASGGSDALDVDATRILYRDTANNRLAFRPVGGGAETVLWTFASGEAGGGILTTTGALVEINTIGSRLYEWRNGTTGELTSGFGTLRQYKTAGDWAIWRQEARLSRRGLSAGPTTQISTNADGGADLAASGDVVFGTGSPDYDVYRYRAGTTTLIAGDPSLRYESPLTDGESVAFSSSAADGSSGRLVRWKDGVTTEVANPGGAPQAVNNGWIAFLRRDGAGMIQIWTAGPDNVVRPVTSGATGTPRFHALGPDGTVVFATSAGRVFAARAPYTSAPVQLGYSGARWFFRGSDLYVLLGRAAFRATY